MISDLSFQALEQVRVLHLVTYLAFCEFPLEGRGVVNPELVLLVREEILWSFDGKPRFVKSRGDSLEVQGSN